MNISLLVKKARDGNPEAFVRLMEAQMQSMYRVAKAYLKNDQDCADVIQDTILVCWEKLGALKTEQYFKTWMTRILINKCKDHMKSCRELYQENAGENEIFWEENFSHLEWEELLESVGETYRSVLILYYGEGYKISEISRLLNLPEATVKTRLKRAREKLQNEYYTDRKGYLVI